MQLLGGEGLFVAGLLLLLPFVILFVLIKLLPPWPDVEAHVPVTEIEPEGDLQPEVAAAIASEA
jgi:hypothetical protein